MKQSSKKSKIKDFYGVNLYGEEEVEALKNVVLNKSPFRYYGLNPQMATESFEEECEKIFNRKFCHTTNSCTGALSCALYALDIGISDEVLMPGYFWIAMAHSVLLKGAIPVLVDIDSNFEINIQNMISKITKKTKSIIVPHMDGIASNIVDVINICKRYNISVIEDFSQSLGAKISGEPLGSFGDVSVASFQVNKMITSGEGGIILTNSEEIYDKCVARSDFGYPRKEKPYEISELTIGEGRRMNEITSSVLKVQLSKLPKLLEDQWMKKEKLLKKINKTPICQLRTTKYFENDNGTTLTLTFENEEVAQKFLTYWESLEMDILCNSFLLKYFGQHIYYNCKTLTEKIPALLPNFPWAQSENEYSYKKGQLKQTDLLVEKSVLLKLSTDLTMTDIINIANNINNYFKLVEEGGL